jgi:hypothetical protein
MWFQEKEGEEFLPHPHLSHNLVEQQLAVPEAPS